ncbi:hypothetical protein [Actinoallomurus sp. NPDC050550]|uniref:hypothetical protein n=1 Tax=Actinoallomurus sp. NPDC050550 TaxID=3154937 RepID=UPI0033F38E8F
MRTTRVNKEGREYAFHDSTRFLIQAGDSTSPEPRTLFRADRVLAPCQAGKELIRGHDFNLWPDAPAAQPVATIRRQGPGSEFSFTYNVQGPDGTLLGTITRKGLKPFPPARARWILRPADQPEAVARKGRLILWWLWLFLFPLTVALYAASAISNGSGSAAPPPRRLILRANRCPILDYRPRKNRYLNPNPALDPRLTAALILIHSRTTLDTSQVF